MSQEIANAFIEKIFAWKKENTQKDFFVSGISKEQWFYFFQELSSAKVGPQFIIFNERNAAEDFYNLTSNFFYNDKNKKILFFPSLDDSPYSSRLYPEGDLYKQFEILQTLCSIDPQSSKNLIIISSALGLIQKQPPLTFFKNNFFEIKKDDIISPFELSSRLINFGYRNLSIIEGPGSFSKRGDILDIYPIGEGAFRLHYFDDLIERIDEIDPENLKTSLDQNNNPVTVNEIKIGPAPQIVINQEFRNSLRQNIPTPQTIYKEKFNKRKFFFESLGQNILFENYPLYIPLFFEQSTTLFEYLKEINDLSIFIFDYEEVQVTINQFFEDSKAQWEEVEGDLNNSNLIPPPEKYFVNNCLEQLTHFSKVLVNRIDIRASQVQSLNNEIILNLENASTFLFRNIGTTANRPEFIKKVFEYLKTFFEYSGNITFCYEHQNAKIEFKNLLEANHFPTFLRDKIIYNEIPLSLGFYHPPSKSLVITEQDLFSKTPRGQNKNNKKTTNMDPDLFAEQLSTLKKGDFVVHSEHGVGQYMDLAAMNVGGASTDFLVINYAEGDKIYVPVYKINLVQKYADQTANLKLGSIRQNKFLAAKEKAKISAKKLAFNLINLLAERELVKSFSFSPPDDLFREFELSFDYEETPDQLRAIKQVLEAMQKNRPMDFLVCGDVGFGKTEVAMRASYKAVLDKKQVALLVPTTILALQHYMSFSKRFKDFPVNVEFISRFKSPKESKIILERLKKGEIDIIIGTHKLLAEGIEYKDLGLVIIDEEHRFGVGHKEKLKLMKASIDFLTLTATPIPRTLQLAFMGLRDLALIKTPPPKRQAIKTSLIKEDPLTLKNAITHELKRGGQIFIVHNKVQDIENYYAYIKELVPEAKIVFAHGQMSESELEKRIKDFYDGKYQILISTTIIESGIDIPNANTLIIDRADTFGLAQLHQLRGRIGRSDRKAYAYFIISENKNISVDAERRLKALQTYSELGSGFALASCDLEIRGAGDILGAEQSGHIEQIGLELYTELLKEAVMELKGEKEVINKNMEISTPFASFIPNHFIQDSSIRLKYYKRLSNLFDSQILEQIEAEIIDIYGPLPNEMKNLFAVFKIRNLLYRACVKSLATTDTTLILKFDQNLLQKNTALRDKIVEVFIKRPKIYQFSPDYKVTYHHKEKFTPETLYQLVKDIAQQIVP